MGRPAETLGPDASNGRPRTSSSSSNGCCSFCRSCSWLLYLMVIVSLSLSMFAFWMSLYKSQETALELRPLKNELNVTEKRLGQTEEQIARLKLQTMESEMLLEEQGAKLRVLEGIRSSGINAETDGNNGDYDYIIEMITDVRSVHRSQINDLYKKVSGWEAANEVTLTALNGIKSKIKEIEEGNESQTKHLRRALRDIRKRLDFTEAKMTELGGRAANATVASTEAIDELMRSEEYGEARLMKLEKRIGETSGRMTTVERDILGLEAEVAKVANATANLEDLISETDQRGRSAIRERFDEARKKMDELSEHVAAMNASMASESRENALAEESLEKDRSLLVNMSSIVGALQDETASLRLGLSTLRTWRDSHDVTLVRVEDQIRSGSEATRDNQDKISRLTDKVDNFRQNVLKVKQLPATVNVLQKRVDALDENLIKILEDRHYSSEYSEVDGDGLVYSEMVEYNEGVEGKVGKDEIGDGHRGDDEDQGGSGGGGGGDGIGK